MASFVHQVPDRFQIRISPCDVWLSNTQHVDGGFIELHKHTIVDLSESEQLHHLSRFWWHTIDTIEIKVAKYHQQFSLGKSV